MNVIRYFLYRYTVVIYPLAAAIISLIISLAVWDFSMFGKVILPFTGLLFALRIQDDIYDYDRDKAKKKQYLTKKQLIFTDAVMWLILIVSNVLSFGVMGLLAILIPAYTFLWEKFPPLKVLFAPLVFLYYVLPTTDMPIPISLMEAAICGCASAIYYVIKKGGGR